MDVCVDLRAFNVTISEYLKQIRVNSENRIVYGWLTNTHARTHTHYATTAKQPQNRDIIWGNVHFVRTLCYEEDRFTFVSSWYTAITFQRLMYINYNNLIESIINHKYRPCLYMICVSFKSAFHTLKCNVKI